MEEASVPSSRLMMLSGNDCPASAQHSSATMNANRTTPMQTRLAALPRGTTARSSPMAIETAPQT